MVIHKWNNEIQGAVIQEWTEGCQEAKSRQALRVLRKQIAEKYGLNIHVVQGIVDLGATQGITQNPSPYGKTYEPINYHELVNGLKERVGTLEKKFQFLLDGIEKVLTDGETMRIHLENLKRTSHWLKKREALDIREMIHASENAKPPLIEIESEEPKPRKPRRTTEPNKRKEKPPKTIPSDSPSLEKLKRLREYADRIRERGEGRLLFQEIQEKGKGKKAIPGQGK